MSGASLLTSRHTDDSNTSLLPNVASDFGLVCNTQVSTCSVSHAEYSSMVRPGSHKLPAWELLALCEVIVRVRLSNGTRRKSADGRFRCPGGSRILVWGCASLLPTPHCCHLKHHHSNGHVATGSPAPGSQATSSMSGVSSPDMYPLMSNVAPGKSCSSCRRAFAPTVFRTPNLCDDRYSSRCP